MGVGVGKAVLTRLTVSIYLLGHEPEDTMRRSDFDNKRVPKKKKKLELHICSFKMSQPSFITVPARVLYNEEIEKEHGHCIH